MRYSGRLGGGTPTILKFQVGETVSLPGIPMEVAGAGGSGLQMVETTTALQTIGLGMDTATYVTAQQTSNAETERLISVIVNPDAIYRAKLSGGATAGTALTEGIEDTGSTDGLLVSSSVSYSSPALDEGSLLGSFGANAGIVRKMTSASGADAVLSVAFPFDIAIGDKFIALPWALSGSQRSQINAMDSQFVELTSDLTQINQAVAVDTDNVNFIPLRLILPGSPLDYATKTYLDIINYDHLYGGQIA